MTQTYEANKPIENTEKIKRAARAYLERSADNGDHEFNDRLELALEDDYLSFDLVKQLKEKWNKSASAEDEKLYLHELLQSSKLFLPKYEPEKPSAEYVRKMDALRAQLDEAAYQKMVYNVDRTSALRFESGTPGKSSIVPEFKTMQGQLVAILNVVLVVGGAFVFGYKAVEYSLDEPDYTKQIIVGFILALIVAVADLYFLFKKLLRIDCQESKKARPTSQRPATTTTTRAAPPATPKSKADKKKD